MQTVRTLRISDDTTLTPFGATTLEWIAADNRPVLWLSDRAVFDGSTPIRGGIPVCLPWFGSADTTQADIVLDTSSSSPAHAPNHGFARTAQWSINEAESTDVNVTLELTHAREDHGGIFPHAFSARLNVVPEDVLSLFLEITNEDDHAFIFEESLHMYVAVGDIKDVTINGLRGARFFDKARGQKWRTQFEELALVRTTNSVYSSAHTLMLTDPRWLRRIIIEKHGSNSTIVWNPWRDGAAVIDDLNDSDWMQFICIDAGNVGENALTLQPGESHVMDLTVRVEMLN
ncbi:D-hexose-6-phosphate mutarotase [Schaalia sp. ZJ405]|uniref:D-hexose-6-phosphate mutarotase n=1 Tax=Schaalia sp. ZJ405 TaxID=2709403 RepID=UPI0013ECF7DA|nr:D-hexose-6-phosphate mutarotase [Schaalia sp. ZJ405]QPK81676.1 D-hexose-6-phosphate mutarotase [Schaalia sp. ZJ405]